MVFRKYHRFIRRWIIKLQRVAHRLWFPPLLLFLAFLDSMIIVVPTDSILISSSMLIKRRWLSFAFFVAIGSALGALLLVYLVDHFGLEKILEFFPEVNQSYIWKGTLDLFTRYGVFIVFIVGLTPLSQQPALIIAAMSRAPIFPLTLAILVSRIIKFTIMAYIASHIPRLLNKLWGMKNEVVETTAVKIN